VLSAGSDWQDHPGRKTLKIRISREGLGIGTDNLSGRPEKKFYEKTVPLPTGESRKIS